MKTLRTLCYVCAGYYLLQGLGFMFAAVFLRMMRGMMPAGLDDNPIVRVQQDIVSVTTAFAPYVLIGVVACLLMAWRLRQWWKAIPMLSVLLFAGGMIWLIAFAQQVKPFTKAISQNIVGMPDAFSAYMDVVTSIGNWSSAVPVLLPAVLIFIFWWRAANSGAPKDAG